MPKLSLEINKTIKKNYSEEAKGKNTFLNPAILRSKSLPNNSEINFEQDTISAIVSPKNGKKHDHKQYPSDLPGSDEKAEKTGTEENTFISTYVINHVINLVDNLHVDTPSYPDYPEPNAD
jgi:hypothetical protein